MVRYKLEPIEKIGVTLVKRFPYLVDTINYFRLQSVKKCITPRFLTVYVTSRCNLNCGFCFYRSNLNRNEQLNLYQLKNIASSLKSHVEFLILTGGEPFLREDIDKIAHFFYKKNNTKRISIPTNGLLTGKILQKTKSILADNGYLNVQVSCGSISKAKKIHKTLYGLKQLMNIFHKLSVSISITVTKQNISTMRDFYQYLLTKYDLNIKFNPFRDSSCTYCLSDGLANNFRKPNLVLSVEDIAFLLNILRASKKDDLWHKFQILKLQYIKTILAGKRPRLNCLVPYSGAVIYEDAGFSLCENTIPLLNLKDYNFDINKAYNSKEIKNYRNKLRKCYCTHPCSIMHSMKYDSPSIKKICLE